MHCLGPVSCLIKPITGPVANGVLFRIAGKLTWFSFVSIQLTAENTNEVKCPAASIIVSRSTLADILLCQN